LAKARKKAMEEEKKVWQKRNPYNINTDSMFL
jgi:tRNA1(Val) A37 N6-methylase TrmN6